MQETPMTRNLTKLHTNRKQAQKKMFHLTAQSPPILPLMEKSLQLNVSNMFHCLFTLTHRHKWKCCTFFWSVFWVIILSDICDLSTNVSFNFENNVYQRILSMLCCWARTWSCFYIKSWAHFKQLLWMFVFQELFFTVMVGFRDQWWRRQSDQETTSLSTVTANCQSEYT